MNKFTKFIVTFGNFARFATYYFLAINLVIGIFVQDHLLNFDIIWWITYLILDTWYHMVVIKPETKSCNENCENCQKLNS